MTDSQKSDETVAAAASETESGAPVTEQAPAAEAASAPAAAPRPAPRPAPSPAAFAARPKAAPSPA
ncbi:DUF349 domain-containing protein, partial [Arthrobacter sp. NPDC080086]